MNIQIKLDKASLMQFEGIISKAVEKAVKNALKKEMGPNNNVKSDDALLTREEVMKMLRISHSTLYHYQKNRTIPFLKFGNRVYFRKSDITKNNDLLGVSQDNRI